MNSQNLPYTVFNVCGKISTSQSGNSYIRIRIRIYIALRFHKVRYAWLAVTIQEPRSTANHRPMTMLNLLYAVSLRTTLPVCFLLLPNVCQCKHRLTKWFWCLNLLQIKSIFVSFCLLSFSYHTGIDSEKHCLLPHYTGGIMYVYLSWPILEIGNSFS